MVPTKWKISTPGGQPVKPVAIFTSVVNDCVYPEIYRFIGINRVVRYIWRKYIITVVIAKGNIA